MLKKVVAPNELLRYNQSCNNIVAYF